MQVNMINRLAAVLADIEDQAVTFLVHAHFFGQVAGLEDQLTQQFRVFVVGFVDGSNVLGRHDQDVHRRGRARVPEGRQVIIAIEEISIRFAIKDAAEDAVVMGHERTSLRLRIGLGIGFGRIIKVMVVGKLHSFIGTSINADNFIIREMLDAFVPDKS